jgi:hypothetical protein
VKYQSGLTFKGTEALYVKGQNVNKLIAHRGGILGVVTLAMDARGPLAMKGNRHPITEAGFGFIIGEIRRDLERALRHGDFEIMRMGEEAFGGRPATVVEARFNPREGRKYYAFRMVIHIDKELLLPVGNVFFDEKEVLFEKYSFTDVRLNLGLGNTDFSRDNEEYRFLGEDPGNWHPAQGRASAQ